MGRILLLFSICLFLTTPVVAAEWAQTYGGKGHESAYSIQQTSDGGYIVAGTSASSGGNTDIWILKLDSEGDVLWEKTYGGRHTDIAWSIKQTSDGGYIVAGETWSFGAGSGDVWVLKLDGYGNIQWQKTYGGVNTDLAYSIQQTSNGYIVAGATESFGTANVDVWVLKLDSRGNVVWQKRYGGMEQDLAYSIQQTSDGGYIVAGMSEPFKADDSKPWVIKLNNQGEVVWQRVYDGISKGWAYSVQQTSDGGCIIAGLIVENNNDAWVLKLNSKGDIVWQKKFGGRGYDLARSVLQTSDGGYVVVGETSSFGAGSNDIWVMKLDSSGDIVWQKTFGGKSQDAGWAALQTADGEYVVAGFTESFGTGLSDIWVLKLDSNGEIPGCQYSQNTNTQVSDTSATVAEPSMHVETTSAQPEDTSVTPVISQATTSQLCYYAPPTQSIPEFSTLGLAAASVITILFVASRRMFKK